MNEPLPNQSDATTIDRATFGGDPVRFLIAFHAMVRHRDRAMIGFDHVDLQWLADVWKEAAIVSRGDMRFLRQSEKFQKLANDLKQGIFERGGEVGVCLLETRDWPPIKLIEKAARLLESAEVRGIH